MTTVVWSCPNCSHKNEVESPVVEARASYGISSVPLETAGNLDGKEVVCDSCKEHYLILSPRRVVNLDLIHMDEGNDDE